MVNRCLLFVPVVIAFSTALPADQPGRRPRREDSMLDVVRRNSLLSCKAGLGHGRNVYLTSTDEKDDMFLNGLAEYECRLETGSSAELYISASAERKQYFSETEASESFFDFFTEYYARMGPVGLGISDTLAWEDFRTFDEEGGTVPAGEYESLANKTRGFFTAQCGANHDMETGFAIRTKDYTSADYDFQEGTLDFIYSWRITPRYRTRLSLANRTQDYHDRRALSADGSTDESNPKLEVDIRTAVITLRRNVGEFAWVDFFVEQSENDENHEKEGAYEERSLGCSCLLGVGEDYVLEGTIESSSRDYDTRQVSGSATTQKDDFLTISLTAERRLKGTTSLYVTIHDGKRDSNDPSENYSKNAITIGVKGIF
jgi:hypothetical protein